MRSKFAEIEDEKAIFAQTEDRYAEKRLKTPTGDLVRKNVSVQVWEPAVSCVLLFVPAVDIMYGCYEDCHIGMNGFLPSTFIQKIYEDSFEYHGIDRSQLEHFLTLEDHPFNEIFCDYYDHAVVASFFTQLETDLIHKQPYYPSRLELWRRKKT